MSLIKNKNTAVIALTLGAAIALGTNGAMALGKKDHRGMMGPIGAIFQSDFSQADLDSDGKISTKDIQAHVAARFSKIDSNGDAGVSKDELTAHFEQMKGAEGHGEYSMEHGKEHSKEHGKEHGKKYGKERSARKLEKMFSKRDRDDNGVLSLEEMSPKQKLLDRMIAHFDTDEDGSLSESEFDAAKAKIEKRKRR